jgi:hypothetical protein
MNAIRLFNQLRSFFVNNILTERNWLDWIHLAHDRDQWRALVNKAMKLRVP